MVKKKFIMSRPHKRKELSKHISIDKRSFYNAFEAAGGDGLDIINWLKWFLQTLEAAMRESQWIVEREVVKARCWEQQGNNSFNARQHNVINRLLDTGEKFNGGITNRKNVKRKEKCTSYELYRVNVNKVSLGHYSVPRCRFSLKCPPRVTGTSSPSNRRGYGHNYSHIAYGPDAMRFGDIRYQHTPCLCRKDYIIIS